LVSLQHIMDLLPRLSARLEIFACCSLPWVLRDIMLIRLFKDVCLFEGVREGLFKESVLLICAFILKGGR
jgi:hypothetical protein